MYRNLLIALLAGILLTACAGSSGPRTEYVILETDFLYQPASIKIPLGQSITLTFNNNGAVQHDFVIQKIAVSGLEKSDAESSMGHDMPMGETEFDLHVATLPGGTSVLTFTPSEAGEYVFFCTVAGHREAGMVGKLIVVISE